MKMIVLAVRDSAMDAFMNPFCAPAIGLASRSFVDEVNNPQSPMNSHPNDYVLFEVGVFDQDTGKLLPLEAPRQVIRGVDALRPKD